MIKTSDPMKRLVIDIETSPDMAGVFGQKQAFIPIGQFIEQTRMLSFAAKWIGESKTAFYSEYHHGRSAMIQAAWDLLNEADVLVHFNGVSFDRKHLNREFLLADFGPPSPYQQVDLLKSWRKQFWATSNKLDNILHLLGDEGKVQHSGFGLWLKCLEGDPKSWALMKKYNIGDVVKTEWVYHKIRPWITNHPNFQLYVGDTKVCPNCGESDTLQSRGERFVYTQLSKYPRFYCTNCKTWPRGKASAIRAEER